MIWKELEFTNPVAQYHDQASINGEERERELRVSEKAELKLL